jgi:hypothetical protein
MIRSKGWVSEYKDQSFLRGIVYLNSNVPLVCHRRNHRRLS